MEHQTENHRYLNKCIILINSELEDILFFTFRHKFLVQNVIWKLYIRNILIAILRLYILERWLFFTSGEISFYLRIVCMFVVVFVRYTKTTRTIITDLVSRELNLPKKSSVYIPSWMVEVLKEQDSMLSRKKCLWNNSFESYSPHLCLIMLQICNSDLDWSLVDNGLSSTSLCVWGLQQFGECLTTIICLVIS